MNKPIIVFDWDDTLFPTTFVNNNIDNFIETILSYDIYLYNFLKNIYNIKYKIIIITNASLSWINFCLNILPKSKLIIDKLKIISARDLLEVKEHSDEWKNIIYKKLVPLFQQFNSIINIGDSIYEHNALKYVSDCIQSPIYSIKFKEAPNVSDIISELNKTISFINYFTINRIERNINILYN